MKSFINYLLEEENISIKKSGNICYVTSIEKFGLGGTYRITIGLDLSKNGKFYNDLLLPIPLKQNSDGSYDVVYYSHKKRELYQNINIDDTISDLSEINIVSISINDTEITSNKDYFGNIIHDVYINVTKDGEKFILSKKLNEKYFLEKDKHFTYNNETTVCNFNKWSIDKSDKLLNDLYPGIMDDYKPADFEQRINKILQKFVDSNIINYKLPNKIKVYNTDED